jgi:hypothetical protein
MGVDVIGSGCASLRHGAGKSAEGPMSCIDRDYHPQKALHATRKVTREKGSGAMNFVMLPQEINSLRMYVCAGSGPMLQAAFAWDGLAGELASAAASFKIGLGRNVVQSDDREADRQRWRRRFGELGGSPNGHGAIGGAAHRGGC